MKCINNLKLKFIKMGRRKKNKQKATRLKKDGTPDARFRQNLKKPKAETMPYNHNNYKQWPPKVEEVPALIMDSDLRNTYKELMYRIFSVQSTSYRQDDMLDFILDFIDDYNDSLGIEGSPIRYHSDKSGNIFVTKGSAETYPCIVAHVDTVHRIIPDDDYKVFQDDKVMFAMNLGDMTQTGIGGDDNVGIFMGLATLIDPTFKAAKFAFFVNEEVGCIGSSACDIDWFDDTSMVLQADRHKYSDIVNTISDYKLYDDAFSNAISGILDKYKKKETSGGMTDVLSLAELGIEVAVLNCSCGYYNPHSSDEYIKIDEVILTLQLFQEIIENLHVDGERWLFTGERSSYGGGFGYGYTDWDDSYAGRWSDYYKKWGGGKTKSLEAEYKKELEEDDEVAIKADSPAGGDCSQCGCKTTYDESAGFDFCFHCNDYVNY